MSASAVRAAILTISSSRAAGRAGDESGDRLTEFARSLGAEIAARDLLADDQAAIEAHLCRWADADRYELILTTGGTGFSPSDVTPEATLAVIERNAPGISQAMLAASAQHTSNWMLSRAAAGIRGRSLIINFPGNPRSIEQAGGAISGALPHALALLAAER